MSARAVDAASAVAQFGEGALREGDGSGGGVGQTGGGSAFASGHRYGLSGSSPLTHPVEWHFVPLQHVRE